MITKRFIVTVTTPDDEDPEDLLREAVETGCDFIPKVKESEEHIITFGMTCYPSTGCLSSEEIKELIRALNQNTLAMTELKTQLQRNLNLS